MSQDTNWNLPEWSRPPQVFSKPIPELSSGSGRPPSPAPQETADGGGDYPSSSASPAVNLMAAIVLVILGFAVVGVILLIGRAATAPRQELAPPPQVAVPPARPKQPPTQHPVGSYEEYVELKIRRANGFYHARYEDQGWPELFAFVGMEPKKVGEHWTWKFPQTPPEDRFVAFLCFATAAGHNVRDSWIIDPDTMDAWLKVNHAVRLAEEQGKIPQQGIKPEQVEDALRRSLRRAQMYFDPDDGNKLASPILLDPERLRHTFQAEVKGRARKD